MYGSTRDQAIIVTFFFLVVKCIKANDTIWSNNNVIFDARVVSNVCTWIKNALRTNVNIFPKKNIGIDDSRRMNDSLLGIDLGTKMYDKKIKGIERVGVN